MPSLTGPADPATRTASGTPREAPFGAPHVYVLVVSDGDDPALTHRIVRAETLIGRGEECHFPIDDEQVSRVHCRVKVEGSVVTIVDAGSRNGTLVNGRRIAPSAAHRLRHLDEFTVGSHRVVLLTGRFRTAPKA
jgi:pSer/pThr/pTyr-binding forkhead associated (FHA) protein